MLETERESVIIGLQKIADTKSVSWWMRNVCLKASGMLRAFGRRRADANCRCCSSYSLQGLHFRALY